MSYLGSINQRGFDRRPQRLVVPQTMPIIDLLEWAFRREYAQIELPELDQISEAASGHGIEYVLLQQAILGVKVDSSIGNSDPHEDAEAVAAIVSGLPEHLGGLRMAISIAELARAGVSPDWMPDAAPKYVPKEWRRGNQHGQRIGATEQIGEHVEETKSPHPKNPAKTITRRKSHKIEITPCILVPSPESITAARGRFVDWHNALRYIRNVLQASNVLRQHSVSDQMPAQKPWVNGH